MVNLLTQKLFDTQDEDGTPGDFLDYSPTERAPLKNYHAVDIDHFCAAMVHTDIRKTIPQYKKLAQDSNPEI